ncbi:MAG: serine/threonine-protein kinase, partial [Verrucomicrobiota bacterium]
MKGDGKPGFFDLDTQADERRRALDDEANLAHGDKIGPFTIEGVIGEGGSSTVFAASQETPVQRTVAIKVPHWQALGSTEVLDAFHAERFLLGSLDHPLIARILDAGYLPSGRPYLVMDHVEGVPLHAHCDGKRLPIVERIRILTRVCAAVHHAHQRGVIHRDLKPQNILVTEDGEPRIIDFGIASGIGSREKNGTAGTPGFISPEQTKGGRIDARTDIHALGCLGWKLCAGEIPREADPRPTATADQAQRCRLEPVGLDRFLKGDLGTIFETAAAPDPNHRYQTAFELGEDLKRWTQRKPVAAAGNSIVYRGRCFFRRHRIACAIAALALIFVTAAGTVALRQTVETFRAKSDLEQALAAEKTERRVAEEVTDFCSRILEGTGGTLDRQTTVAELLETTSDELLNEFQGDPAIKSRLCFTLAKAAESRNLFALALPLCRESVRL